MNTMTPHDLIDKLAKIYDTVELQYNQYAKHFENVSLKESELKEFPAELAKVIRGTWGEQSIKWVQNKVPALDNRRPVDLVKTECGIKALKMILFRMPE